jgi:quercetin dioxygenase-like cupin family protein
MSIDVLLFVLAKSLLKMYQYACLESAHIRRQSTMKKYLLLLVLALLCACAMALSETNNSTSTVTLTSNTTSINQINGSTAHFALVNMTQFGEDHPINPVTGFNISQAASGNNASTNLVQASPGSIIKMHYHKYRDEIAYITEGEAIFTISGNNYTEKAGDLIYIPAMTLHRVAVIGNATFKAVSTFAPPFDGKDRIYVEP